MVALFFQYWGKSASGKDQYHPAAYHCLDVAAVGHTILSLDSLVQKRLADLTGWSKEDSIRFITFWLSIHDLGKFSESFQGQIPELFHRLNNREARLGYLLRHDMLGSRIWEDNILEDLLQGNLFPLPDGMKPRDLEAILKYPAAAAFGHHGIPPEKRTIQNYSASQLYSAQDADAARSFVIACADLFFGDHPFIPAQVSKEKRIHFAQLSWIIAGIAVFADWIASDALNFRYCMENMPLEKYWETHAIPQAIESIKKAGIIPPVVSEETGVEALFPIFRNKKFVPSPLQNYSSETPIGKAPHLFIIEESTGGGKTEAAITLAHRLMAEGCAEGFYIGLPTMATANAMYERIVGCHRNLYDPNEEPSLILAHGARQHSQIFLQSLSAFNRENKRNDSNGNPSARAVCSRWLSDNRKKALLAPVGVGTIDQALISILPSRHQSLRLFGLFRNVLIVDEVHAYDSYMARLLQTLLAFLAALGGSCILLSATLPLRMKKDFIQAFAEGAGWNPNLPESSEYPLVTRLSEKGLEEIPIPARDGTGRTVDIELIHDTEQIKDRILSALRGGKCVCWVRNTVQDALDTYHDFSPLLPSESLSLFHSRFAMGDRLKIEQEVLARFGQQSTPEERAGHLLIATQVVEQSLDIDFDHMVTDLAPVDLIIQRAGRLHRHQRKEERGDPILWIYSPIPGDSPGQDWYSSLFPRASYVYPKHGDLYLTARLFAQLERLKTPEEARLLIEGVFGDSAQNTIPGVLQDRDARAINERNRAEGLAMLNALNFRKGYEYGESRWGSDENTPTRLAEPTVTLRLGRYDEGAGIIRPWDADGQGRWDLSQVTVRRQIFPFNPVFDPETEKVVDQAQETMPDRGEWSILLPLRREDDRIYGGVFVNSDGDRIFVRYTQQEGIMLSKA